MLTRICFLITAASAVSGALAAPPGGPGPLEGKWSNGRTSSIQYRDAYTGVDRPPTGNYFAYEFRSDGTYTFTGMMQSTMYNCTTTMFGEESGTYAVPAAGIVALHPVKNPFKMTNNCAPRSNREAPGKLVDRSYRFTINGERLEFAGEDGAVQAFQRDRAR